MRSETRKTTTISILITCVLLLWLPLGGSARVALVEPLTKSVVDTEAAKYKRAITELSRIEGMSLKTDADFKSASAIINDQTENLRFFKYRMVQLALSNIAFTAALESEFAKSKGNEDLVLQRFRRTPTALTSLSGARTAQQSIAAELKRDFQRIESASGHLRDAASLILNRRGSVPRSVSEQPVFVTARYEVPLAIDDYFEALFAASTVIAGAVRSPATKLPVGSSSGGDASGGATSSSGPATWAQDEQEYQECARQAGVAQDRCKSNCGPGFFQWACLANCAASYMLKKAGCALNSIHSY